MRKIKITIRRKRRRLSAIGKGIAPVVVRSKKPLPKVAAPAPSETIQNDIDVNARLPYFGTVYDEDGEKIGKVRRNVYYDLDRERQGKFKRQDSAVYLIDGGERKGYLDRNFNLFTVTDQSYVATIKRSRLWLILLIILLTIALTSALFAAFYTPKSENYIPVLFIADEDGTSWEDQHNLPVFFNKKFGDNVIEPGSTGRYAFILENRNADEIIFDLTFSCENEYGIQLVYRLKRDGAYVAGYEDYVPAEQLNLKELTQQARSTSVFELEWTWQHNDSVDTIAGESGAIYKLHIHFLAEVNHKK